MYDTLMEKILPNLPTQQLLDLGEDLNLHGQTDEDWTLFELVVAELWRRKSLFSAPYWMFD